MNALQEVNITAEAMTVVTYIDEPTKQVKVNIDGIPQNLDTYNPLVVLKQIAYGK